MATVAEHYGMPRFIADAGIEELRNWARQATAQELVAEHKAMLACVAEFPRYLKMLGWLETIANLRGIRLP